ncbi:MAG: hypothetical protein WAO28_04330 [Candidatus Microsaccharimonas sp.]
MFGTLRKRREDKDRESRRAAEAERRAKADAEQKRRDRRFWAIAIPIIVVVLGGMIAGMTAYITWSEDWPARMEAETGIINGEEYDLLIADSTESYDDIRGTFVFFAGSISSSHESTLRVAYTSPKGVVYILDVPIDEIEFLPDGRSPTGSFEFRHWSDEDNLQENIDTYLTTLTINLSREQLMQLIDG